MPIDDASIKTSLRLPRTLHSELERVAADSGLSLNAEMILRLERNPHDDSARAILEEIRARDATIADGLGKQINFLWGALKRADDVLARVETALSRAPEEGDAGVLRREVEFARQLISAVEAHK